MKPLFILTTLLLAPALGLAATIYVPDDFGTIQGAIDHASSNATIIVRPGTYVENIDFLGKAVAVRSERGPGFTSIDGNQLESAVTFSSGEGAGSILEGFTITNGKGRESG